MIYHRFPLILTIYLTSIGLSINYQIQPSLSTIKPYSQTILLAQNNQNQLPLTQLKIGDKGEGVKILQNNLKNLSYYTGEITGTFDENTKKAVSEFQTKNRLIVTGNATIKTQQLLQDLLFDQYMNQGYNASEKKDYKLAKNNFEKALQIKPNNIYASKALTNINKYLIRIEETIKKEAENQKKLQDKLWLITFISIPSLFLIVLISFLLKNNKKTEPTAPIFVENIEKKEPKSETNIPEKTEIITQEIVTSNNINLSNQEDNNRLNKVDGIEELIKDLSVTHGATRRKAIWELAQRADSRAMQPLVQLMLEADSQERSLILEAISQISTRTLKPLNRALSLSLNDENSQVRLNAIRDLTRIYELIAEVNQRLYHATDDEDPEVRETATWALKNLNKMQLPYNSDHNSPEE